MPLVRSLRRSRGLTFVELARLTSIPTRILVQIEYGLYPLDDQIRGRLSKVFGLPPDQINSGGSSDPTNARARALKVIQAVPPLAVTVIGALLLSRFIAEHASVPTPIEYDQVATQAACDSAYPYPWECSPTSGHPTSPTPSSEQGFARASQSMSEVAGGGTTIALLPTMPPLSTPQTTSSELDFARVPQPANQEVDGGMPRVLPQVPASRTASPLLGFARNGGIAAALSIAPVYNGNALSSRYFRKSVVTLTMQVASHFNTVDCSVWGDQMGCMHWGTDYIGHEGDPVFTPFDLQVIRLGEFGPGPTMGQYVQGTLPDGYVYYSGHLKEVPAFSIGQILPAGTFIGRMNSYAHTHIQLALPGNVRPCAQNGTCLDFETYYAMH